jgi:predicted DNA-binding ribbon-helix-helix protein
LFEIAHRESLTTSALVERIAHGRKSDNLSSAIRMFVFNHFQTRDRQKAFSNIPGLEIPAAAINFTSPDPMLDAKLAH